MCSRDLHAAASDEPPLALTGNSPSLRQPGHLSISHVKSSSTWNDFLDFKWMITPYLVRGAFALACIGCVLVGGYQIYAALDAPRTYRTELVVQGSLIIVFGPIVYRMIAECIMVFFRIHASLESMDRKIGED